jgi:methylmalonyl-CoA/ethylmalonyl-CoA epimerase
LAKKGPGIQQLCLAVDDLESMIEHLLENQIMMIDSTPRKGAHDSLIAFVHPKSTGGILVELKQR